MRSTSAIAALALGVGFTALAPCTLHAGRNAGATASLAWDAFRSTTTLTQIPATPVPLYVLLDGLQSVKALGFTLEWFPFDAVDSCYIMERGPDSETQGWAQPASVPGALAGDSTYGWTTVLPTGQTLPTAIVLMVRTHPCDPSEMASFLLRSVIAMDSTDALDTLSILGGAAIQPNTMLNLDTPHLLLRFQPGVMGQSDPDGAAAPVATVDSLGHVAQCLLNAGISDLAPQFPGTPLGAHWDTNLIGERVLLPDLSQHYIAYLQPDADATFALTSLRAAYSFIAAADTDHVMTPAGSPPNDPFFGEQWYLYNPPDFHLPCSGPMPTFTPGIDIGVLGAWDSIPPGAQVHVGVFDTGISAITDLENRVNVPSNLSPYDTTGHGTCVASLIASARNDSFGIAGVMPTAIVDNLPVVNDLGRPTMATAVSQIGVAVGMNIPIYTFSITVGCESTPGVCKDVEGSLRSACRTAYLRGVFIAAAMGNDNARSAPMPASFDRETEAVGAVAGSGVRWVDSDVPTYSDSGGGSNYGPDIDIAAPAGRYMVQDVFWAQHLFGELVTLRGPHSACDAKLFGHNGLANGTSAATALVSGCAALLKARFPDLLGEDIAFALEGTTKLTPAGGWNEDVGHGLVQVDSALRFLAPPRRYFHAQRSAGVADVSDVMWHTFIDTEGLPSGAQTQIYLVRRYHLVSSIAFPDTNGWAVFQGAPAVLVRGSGTAGSSAANPTDGTKDFVWSRVVPGSLSEWGCQVETYTYEILHDSGAHWGWWPVEPNGVTTAITAFGMTAPVRPPVVAVGARKEVKAWSLELGASPSRGHVQLSVTAPVAGSGALVIYDLQGRRVFSSAIQRVVPGDNRLVWDGELSAGTAAPDGVYFVRWLPFGHERRASLQKRVVFLR